MLLLSMRRSSYLHLLLHNDHMIIGGMLEHYELTKVATIIIILLDMGSLDSVKFSIVNTIHSVNYAK